MKKYAKIAIWVLAGLIAVGGTIYYLNMPVDIDTVTVHPTVASEYFIEEGSVKDVSAISVYSTMSGVIVERVAQEGEIIEEGGIICVLDVTELENAIDLSRIAIDGYKAQKDNIDEQQEALISELNAALVGMRSELRNVTAQEADYIARVNDETYLANEEIAMSNEVIDANRRHASAQVRAARMAVSNAEDNFEAVEHLDDDDEDYIIAKQALDKAKADLRVAENLPARRIDPADYLDVRTYTEYYASLKQSLRERIALAEKQITEDYTESMHRYYDTVIAGEETRIELMEKNIADCTIRSPASGKIAELYVKDSNIVSTAAPVALVETERSRDIEVFVTTRDYADIYLGQTVEIIQSSSSGDIVFSGVVKEIGSEAETRLSSLGIAERVVKIVIEPEEDERASLLPGFSFDVRIITYHEENKLLVPKTAVFKYSANRAASGIIWQGGDRTGSPVTDIDMVFDASTGKVVMREVRLGRELRSDYVIEAGLSAGSVVIKDSSDENIRVGMNVR